MTLLIPSTLTMVGLIVGAMGAIAWPAHQMLGLALLSSSLVFDVCDGWVARELGAVSDLGGELDWTTDVALSHVIVWQCLDLPLLSLALVAWQAYAHTHGQRVSGRVFVTALARTVHGRRVARCCVSAVAALGSLPSVRCPRARARERCAC